MIYDSKLVEAIDAKNDAKKMLEVATQDFNDPRSKEFSVDRVLERAQQMRDDLTRQLNETAEWFSKCHEELRAAEHALNALISQESSK